MSVKIKDMYLPDSCAACPLCLLDRYGNERYCFATGNRVDIDWDSYRSSECPMEEVGED